MGLHDEDISKEEILAQGFATPEEYEILEKYTLDLFENGEPQKQLSKEFVREWLMANGFQG